MITLADLCQHLNIAVPEKREKVAVNDVKPLHLAGPGHLSFLDNPAYKAAAETTQATAVFIRPQEAALLPPTCTALITPQPYVAFAQSLQLFHPVENVQPGISQFAVVSASATIHPTARIEPYAVIYAGATIGAESHIGAHSVIGQGVVVGSRCSIGAHVTLAKTTIGNNCLFHPGVRVGQDGFGFAAVPKPDGSMDILKIPQVGHVVIGNNVEVGANTTIDCGALEDTTIEDDVKIDNQVQIGHNARIGKGSRLVAQSAIAGSATLGQYTVIGGKSAVAGHLTIANKVMVAALSGVTKSITAVGSVVAGMPASPINEWRRTMATLARLSRHKTLPPASSTHPENTPETDEAAPLINHNSNPFA